MPEYLVKLKIGTVWVEVGRLFAPSVGEAENGIGGMVKGMGGRRSEVVASRVDTEANRLPNRSGGAWGRVELRGATKL